MYGILGEDDSDVDTLDILIRRLQNKHKLTATQNFKKGYKGTGKLHNDGWRALGEWSRRGCAKFVIAQDADEKNVDIIRTEIVKNIIKRSGITACMCIVVPVQEIEAWLLADITKASLIFGGWKPKDERNPESIRNPKEYLEKLSRQANGKPRYSHAKDNKRLAENIDLELLVQRCPSFKPLENLVVRGEANS